MSGQDGGGGAYKQVGQPPAYTSEMRDTNSTLRDNVVPCMNCSEPYPLPKGAPSFRCKSCGHFNNIQRSTCILL